MNVMVSLSATPMAHPPRSNPFLRSSSDAPPFPCITPSTVTCVMVVSFMIAVPFSLGATPRERPLTPATNTSDPIRHRLPDFFRGLSGTPVLSDSRRFGRCLRRICFGRRLAGHARQPPADFDGASPSQLGVCSWSMGSGEPAAEAAEIVKVPAEPIELQLFSRDLAAGDGAVVVDRFGHPEIARRRSQPDGVPVEQRRAGRCDQGVVGLRFPMGDDPSLLVLTKAGCHRVVPGERFADLRPVPPDKI